MIGFIGYGRMGRALAEGAVASKILKAKDILASDPELRSQVDAATVVNTCGIVFLCVKPQVMGDVLATITNTVSLARRQKVCFVSIAAGVPLSRLEKTLGKRVPVVRVMPNTPALLKSGMSVVSRGRFVSSLQERAVVRLLNGVGETVTLAERHMDAVTAVSGSGPAYVFYLAEAMIDAAVGLKLPPALARVLAHQTIFGAGRMLKERTEDAAELRRQVTSPKGTTAAAIEFLDQAKTKMIFGHAIKRAARRAAELAKI